MLKDVLKFFLIFPLLYIAFFTGTTKIYTYYIAAQNKLRSQNETQYDISHPFENKMLTWSGSFQEPGCGWNGSTKEYTPLSSEQLLFAWDVLSL